MKFENDRQREPFKVKGSSSKNAQYQIKEFPNTNDWLRLIDLRTGKKAKHEDFFYLMGREIEIVDKNSKMKKYPLILSKERYISLMISAVEWGFKQHEKGHNLEYARSKFTNELFGRCEK